MLFTLVFVVIFGVAGLTVDVGMVYLNQAKLQAAVDAGALAGAQTLAQGNSATTAQATAKTVAAENVSNAQFNPILSGNKMTVTANEKAPTYFAQLFGVHNWNISTTATAAYSPIVSAKGIMPFGVTATAVQDAEQNPSTEVSLTASNQSAGNWGYLSIGGNGANTLASNIQNGSPGTFKVGDSITTKPGKNTGPVASAIQSRIDADSGVAACSSYSTATESCNRVVTVPVMDGFSNGRSSVTVEGVAEFYLEPYNGGIWGYFIKALGNGDINLNSPPQDFGADAVKLIQ